MAITNSMVDCCFDIAIFWLGKYLNDTCIGANVLNSYFFLTILIFDLFSKSVIHSFCIAGIFPVFAKLVVLGLQVCFTLVL